MKKYLPYILIGLMVVAVGFLFYAGRHTSKKRVLNTFMSFRKKDKIPYGTFVAYESLKQLFPSASVSAERKEPGYWDSLSEYDTGQALIIVAPEFNASESEMKKLIRFVESGNDVFVSTMKASYYAEKFIKCDIYYPVGMNMGFFQAEAPDSLTVSLGIPATGPPFSFTYPGHSFDFWFYRVDSSTSDILGYHKNGYPDYIHLKAGGGNLYLHLAPMAFTNYFLLHKNNIGYYEKALSVISPDTKKIVWDEYFLQKRDAPPEKNRGWLSALMNMKNSEGEKSFRTAIWVLLLLLLLYVLVEMRRKQRQIPVLTKPRNDSMEFVKTIGRLYHDKGDHKNLCRKMAAYFLEQVRSRYKLPTAELNEAFIAQLHFKSGVPEAEIRSIVSFIKEMDTTTFISSSGLAHFHKQLEKFYQYS